MRIAFMAIRLFLKTPYYILKMWWYARSDRHTEEEKYAFLKFITKKANHAGRVNIRVYGLENIPDKNGFVFFPNHQGLYDVLAFLDTCPVPFSIVMKKEASNVILVKQVLELLKGIAIDRNDIRQSMKVIMQMTEEVKQGRNYLIFAEGTRSRNKNELLDFKGGSFKSAVNAKCPIVPVALIDSYKPFDEKSIQKVTMQIHYLEPIYYSEYQGMKTHEIANIVKDRIHQTILQYENSI